MNLNPFSKYKSFSIFFALVLVFNVVSILFIPEFFKVAKVLIMASLIGFYSFEMKNQHKAILLAMIAALMGDIFLLFETQDFFLLGMLSFLICHVLYIIRFKEDISELDLKVRFYIPIFLVVLAVVNVLMTRAALGGLLFYVLIYSVVLSVMASAAYLRDVRLPGYTYVYMGGILFMVSDLLLAVNKFQAEIPYAQLWVILTYAIAQYFIITGLVLQKEKTESEPTYKSHLSHSAISKLNKK